MDVLLDAAIDVAKHPMRYERPPTACQLVYDSLTLDSQLIFAPCRF
jgi:hypothetical protein